MQRLDQRMQPKSSVDSNRTMHGPFSRICVAIDASVAAESAARLAISLVHGNGRAEVVFCHVIDVPRMIARADDGVDDYGLSLQLARQTADVALARCCLLSRQAGVFARSYVRYGKPASEAVSFAEGLGVDLVVIGNRPTEKIHRILNGSIRDEMVRTCALPILVANARWARPVDFRPRCILVPGADLPAAKHAKQFAADLADDFAAQLILLPAVHNGLREETDAIDRAVHEHRPDLIAMARTQRHGLRNPFATDVIERVLQEAYVPVLVVRAVDIIEGR